MTSQGRPASYVMHQSPCCTLTAGRADAVEVTLYAFQSGSPQRPRAQSDPVETLCSPSLWHLATAVYNAFMIHDFSR